MLEVLSRTAEELLEVEMAFQDDVEPYSQYTAVVVPQTGGGEGMGVSTDFTSPEQGGLKGGASILCYGRL
jgi:hypothetical protein